jgi:hypothetical protein
MQEVPVTLDDIVRIAYSRMPCHFMNFVHAQQALIELRRAQAVSHPQFLHLMWILHWKPAL